MPTVLMQVIVDRKIYGNFAVTKYNISVEYGCHLDDFKKWVNLCGF